jgi:hypothetical protein
MTWDVAKQVAYLEKLLAHGVIGTYRSFEVTELIGFRREPAGNPINILSLLVAEPAEPPEPPTSKPRFLNLAPRRLRGADWAFGVTRYRVSPRRVLDAIRALSEGTSWALSDDALSVGQLAGLAPQFVPADSNPPHPLNGVLKNNFWGGSHVLEFFDAAKSGVKFFLDKPELLIELATLLRPYVPMGIDGLSDRLGNVLIQFPVTVVTAAMRGSPEGHINFELHWHPLVAERPLRVSCEKYDDATVEGYGSKTVASGPALFPLYLRSGGVRHVVWDDANEVIVGASADSYFITSIALNLQVVGAGASTRQFLAPDSGGGLQATVVPLAAQGSPQIIGRPTNNPCEPWRSHRILRDSLKALRQRKEFMQYGGPSAAGRAEALADIRWLIARHGDSGVWLWDPYLGALDVLSTLFFCPHPQVDLRALTMGREPPCGDEETPGANTSAVAAGMNVTGSYEPAQSTPEAELSASVEPPTASAASEQTKAEIWKSEQASVIEQAKGNCAGLRLEYRIRIGNAGWPFHDRFIIFPGGTGGAMAWSLGTSVNSLGRQHHILQKVSDGELIRLAFDELWNQLGAHEHLLWKTP